MGDLSRRQGEFRSTATYPDLGGHDEQTNVLGHFGDSLVPLHGYRFRGNLRSDNPYWNITSKVADEQHVYCGPGLWYDLDTGPDSYPAGSHEAARIGRGQLPRRS